MQGESKQKNSSVGAVGS